MADNFDEIRDGFIKLFDDLRDHVQSTGDIIIDSKKASEKGDADAKKRSQDLYDKQLKAVNALSNAVGGTVRAFGQGSGSFQGLATATEAVAGAMGGLLGKIPVFGGFLEGATKALGQAASYIIQTFDKFYSNYQELSKVGIVTTTTDFKNAMAATKLNIEDTSKVLGKYSKELAYFGGSAIGGRVKFEGLAFESENARRELQRLGMSAVEYSETQLDYLNLLAKTGRLAGKSNTELAKGSKEYALEIDKLSKLTGLSREQVRKDLESRLSDARYRAGIATLGDTAQQGIQSFLQQLRVLGPDMEEGMKDLIASAGIPSTDAAQKAFIALSQGGINVQQFVENLRAGTLGGTKAMVDLAKSTTITKDRVQQLTSIIGTESAPTGLYVALANISDKLNSGAITQEEAEEKIKEAQKAATEGRDKENRALADTKNSLYNLQNNIEQLTLSVSTVPKVMKFFSDSLEEISDKLLEFSGEPLSEPLKLRKQERALRAEISSLEKRSESGTMGLAQSKDLIDKKKQLESIQQRRAELRDQDISEYGSAGMSTGYTKEDLKKMGLKIKDSAHRDGAYISPATLRLASTVQNALKDRFDQFTSFNDNHQRAPGSKHPLGGAFDFTLKGEKITPEEGQNLIAQIKNMGAANVLDEYNFKTSMASGPHMHVEAFADGGTIHNPTLSLMGEAGSEAVVPLPDGRSIPVSLNNAISEKLDALISATQRQTSLLSNVFDRLA
jgi:hypothetical protein